MEYKKNVKYLIHFLWQDTKTFEVVLEKFDCAQLQKKRSSQNSFRIGSAFGECNSGSIGLNGKTPNLPKLQSIIELLTKTEISQKQTNILERPEHCCPKNSGRKNA